MDKSLRLSEEEDKNMEKTSEYDIRQLKLMHESLICFEKKSIYLSTLIANLEFLLSTLESADEDWEEEFLNELTDLETINALEIIKDSGEDVPEIRQEKKDEIVKKSILVLKNLTDPSNLRFR